MITTICNIGGMFAILVFIHFVADWVFQTHEEAMAKSHDSVVRARHCINYTGPFVILFILLNLGWFSSLCCASVLFFSHFVEDTYWPVFIWAKYVRKMPSLNPEPTEIVTELGEKFANAYEKVAIFAEKQEILEAFKKEWGTPIGAILFITIDQLIHIAFLIPVAIALVLR